MDRRCSKRGVLGLREGRYKEAKKAGHASYVHWQHPEQKVKL